MNLKNEFNNALNLKEFELLLGENKVIHDLHYKKFDPDQSELSLIRSLGEMKLLVITEPWCGDSLASLPVLMKMGEINSKWEIRILLRDENTDLMDRFLTNGGRAIPVFLFLAGDGLLISRWGPRPGKAKAIFEDHRDKIESGEIDRKEVYLKLRKFYAVNRGKEIMNTIVDLLVKQKI